MNFTKTISNSITFANDINYYCFYMHIYLHVLKMLEINVQKKKDKKTQAIIPGYVQFHKLTSMTSMVYNSMTHKM